MTREAQPRRDRRRVVGLLIRQDISVKRRALLGIARYARETDGWELEMLYDVVRNREWTLPPSLDGLIAWPDQHEHLDFLNRLALPTVCLGNPPPGRHPRVLFDNEAIGTLIADYLMKRGLKHFAAFCERYDESYSRAREAGFRRRLEANGFGSLFFDAGAIHSDTAHWDTGLDRIAGWLKTLPKPIGILADRDGAGLDLLRVCRHAGLNVPDDVAVVSVGSDETVCAVAQPPMSAVPLPGEAYGYAAARLLDSWMEKRGKPSDVVFDTFFVEERGSSNLFAGDDSAVVAALRFIRDHTPEGIGVAEVVRAAGISRRLLELRFKKATARTPHEEIIRARVAQAERLLSGTDLPLAEIAERSGFRETARLAEAFKRVRKMTPGAFRKKAGKG